MGQSRGMPRPIDGSDGHDFVRHRGSGGRVCVAEGGDATEICEGGGEGVEGGDGLEG